METNQKLTKEEKLAVTLSLLGVLIALLFITYPFIKPYIPSLATKEQGSENISAETQITQKASPSKTLGDSLTGFIQTIDQKNKNLVTQNEELIVQNRELKKHVKSSIVKKQDPQEPQAIKIEQTPPSPKPDLANNKLKQSLADMQAKITELTKGYEVKINDLQQQISQFSKGNDTQSKLIAQIEGLQLELQNWQKKYQMLEKTSQEALAQYKNQITRFQKQASSSAILAQNEKELTSTAADLITALRKIGDEDASKLNDIYKKIQQKSKSQRLLAIPFKSGKASLTQSQKEQIQNLVKQADKEVSFLVVGYASQDGKASANKKLSERRAKNTATEINTHLGEMQFVRAFFLGATSRFDEKPSGNRLVEIWKL